MGYARRGEVAIRVDHISGSITSVDEALVAPNLSRDRRDLRQL